MKQGAKIHEREMSDIVIRPSLKGIKIFCLRTSKDLKKPLIGTKDSMAKKILKALDEHGEALKKMGGRLTRLEESKLK